MARKRDDEPEQLDTSPPVNDAYTGMLAIALLALIGGSVLLYLDASQYEFKQPSKTLPAKPAAEATAPVSPPVSPPEKKEEPKVEEKKAPEVKPEEKKEEPKKEEEKKL